jgi:hypothetical protein
MQKTSTLLHLAAKHREKGVISILAGDFGADVEATDSVSFDSYLIFYFYLPRGLFQEGRCWHEDFEDKGVNNWPFFRDFSLHGVPFNSHSCCSSDSFYGAGKSKAVL